jgi:DNA-directed RNA polymerase sigma subunit (sigma70/sigma32)
MRRRKQNIRARRLVLAGQEFGFSLSQTAKLAGVSRERVRQIAAKWDFQRLYLGLPHRRNAYLLADLRGETP